MKPPIPRAEFGEPVLFVHGYTIAPDGPTLGGGKGTWGEMPGWLATGQEGLGAEVGPVTAFEFQWATNARFSDVATELRIAVNRIFERTGKRVTIVAHSFGGILVRTMLQATGPSLPGGPTGKVRQVVTIGTPHSGIAREEQTHSEFEVTLPVGQDQLVIGRSAGIRLCAQISCYEMGESLLEPLAGLLGLDASPGRHAARIAHGRTPVAVPIAAAIGLSAENLVTRVLRNSDGLISLAGQRYDPHRRKARGIETAKAMQSRK